MKDISQKLSVITADLALFDFLQEKTGERKTRTEAYCDLLDKASAGYVSPFVKKSDVILQPRQCHVTITDLADQWKWHRATIRSFMKRLEELGQLATDKQPKSVVITMPCDANLIRPHVGTLEGRFAERMTVILSEWTNGNISSKEVCRQVEQCVNDALAEVADNENTSYTQGAGSADSDAANHIRQIAMALVVKACVQHELRNASSYASDRHRVLLPLEEFFKEDLGGDWLSFMEAAGMLAEVILTGDSPSLGAQSPASKSAFLTLRHPFLTMLTEQIGDKSSQGSAIGQ